MQSCLTVFVLHQKLGLSLYLWKVLLYRRCLDFNWIILKLIDVLRLVANRPRLSQF